MLKSSGGALALLGIGALSLFLLNCGSSSSRPAGLLYVVSEAQSSVASFSVDLNNGNLSLVNSNATTCTTLTQSPSVSCGLAVDILLDPTGATASVLNQGVPDALTAMTSTCPSPPCGILPTIYPYSVNSDGSLSAPGTPVTWVDQQDNDIAASMVRDPGGNLLFVMNQGTNPAPANCPHQPTVPNDACPSISVFNIASGSTTPSLTGNNCPERSGPCPYRLATFPTALSVLTFTPPNSSATQTLLFVTGNLDLTGNHNDNQLLVFSVDSSGNLTPQLSPLNQQYYTTLPGPMAVQAVNTNAPPQTTGGVFVFVGTQGSGSGSVSAFQVCTVVGQGSGNNTCNPQEVAANQLIPVGTPAGAGKSPAAMVVDPTNNFLYVLSSGTNQLFAFKITNGTTILTTLSNLPTGGGPVAVAMQTSANSLNNFVYTSNSTGGTITGFAASTTTGQLGTSPSTTLFTPGLPSGMAAR